MNTAASSDPRIVSVSVDGESIAVCLADGRTVSVPLELNRTKISYGWREGQDEH